MGQAGPHNPIRFNNQALSEALMRTFPSAMSQPTVRISQKWNGIQRI